MKEFFIKQILSFLFGITTAQWRAAIDKVIDLSEDITHSSNDSRAVAFITWFVSKFGGEQRTWIVETLRNLAVAFARKKGWIAP